MGFLKRKSNGSTGEHLPAFIQAECIGEACPNFRGENCGNTEMEWMVADGPTKDRDTSKPPLKDEAIYIIYGQRCLEGAADDLVAQRVEVYKPEEFSMMKIIALTGRYGDMPVDIVNAEQTAREETTTSTD